jgi:hypothetical protein
VLSVHATIAIVTTDRRERGFIRSLRDRQIVAGKSCRRRPLSAARLSRVTEILRLCGPVSRPGCFYRRRFLFKNLRLQTTGHNLTLDRRHLPHGCAIFVGLCLLPGRGPHLGVA